MEVDVYYLLETTVMSYHVLTTKELKTYVTVAEIGAEKRWTLVKIMDATSFDLM